MSAKRDDELALAARALVLAECEDIGRALATRSRLHESIHAARKAIRRLRAFIALAEPRLPGLSVADGILAALGDELSPLRDAHVAVLTATRLGATLGMDVWAPAVSRLTTRRSRLLRQALLRDPRFRRKALRVKDVARRLRDVDWNALKPGDLRRGLKESRRRIARAKRRAQRRASRDDLHRWRRRVRQLRMQLEAVRIVAPKVAERAAKSLRRSDSKTLHQLAEALGERLDVDVLRDLLQKLPAFPGRDARLAELANVSS